MGNSSSSTSSTSSSNMRTPPLQRAKSIQDNYFSLEDLKQDLRRKGLESSNLIIGVDFTKSNEWTGKRTFHGRCLHDLTCRTPNPYEQVMEIVSKTLYEYDDDNVIPCFGFGDDSTRDTSVFSFMPMQPNGELILPGYRLNDVRTRYRDVVPHVIMAGPTTFAPMIYQAINIVQQNNMAYHILVIIADGQVTRSVDTPDGQFSKHEQETINAINFASNFPLSIIVVGVGDGPWDMMHIFDDKLQNRRFDNFQFVDFDGVTRGISDPRRMETQFALNALMEIPDQYHLVRQLNLMSASNHLQIPSVPVVPSPYIDAAASNSFSYPGPNINSLPSYPNPSFSSNSTSFTPSYAPNPIPKAIPVYQPSAPVPAVPIGPQKQCHVCTYFNPITATRCEVCTAALSTNAPRMTTPADTHLVESMHAIHEAQLCPICQDKMKDTVFQCGHETCDSCSTQISQCPICRVPISTRIHRYMNSHRSIYSLHRLLSGDELTPSSSQTHCNVCVHKLVFWHKHHCRVCGEVVCGRCRKMTLVQLPDQKLDEVKVCLACIQMLSSTKRDMRASMSTSTGTLSSTQSCPNLLELPDDRCYVCNKSFNSHRQKHFCRKCGEGICHGCRMNKVDPLLGDQGRDQLKQCWTCIASDVMTEIPSYTMSRYEPVCLGGLPRSTIEPMLLPDYEIDRLQELYSFNVLDSPQEDAFDIICDVASKAYSCPIAVVSFIDDARQWFKAQIGLSEAQLPRSVSLCNFVVDEKKAMAVLDTHDDTRFAHHPLVVNGAKIRYYAGAPIVSPRDYVLGTVFVLDTKPHISCNLSRLVDLAAIAMKSLRAKNE
ncbi:E3 ubiquitin-protein ligase RGLG2-like [Thraustotheca clavata]|uniref:E3 ubiquitin-protein ligase RGLG2-like n=1 Tax=Thraustotheca clavata TaxID=74557 RepID=A0A1W0A870_9STRA|nr:E3 ubiquitin-protein ligase RGLG2-like [Thraustotheca clavata]